jgi:hypothetical protein
MSSNRPQLEQSIVIDFGATSSVLYERCKDLAILGPLMPQVISDSAIDVLLPLAVQCRTDLDRLIAQLEAMQAVPGFNLQLNHSPVVTKRLTDLGSL